MGRRTVSQARPRLRLMSTITANGANGTVTFDGSTLTLTRRSLAGRLTQGPGVNTVPVSSVQAVELTLPNFLTNGSIRFSVGGVAGGGGIAGAVMDPFAVIFRGRARRDFETLAEAVHNAIAARAASSAQQSDPADELRKLSALHDDGIVSDAEYDAKKTELLGRM